MPSDVLSINVSAHPKKLTNPKEYQPGASKYFYENFFQPKIRLT